MWSPDETKIAFISNRNYIFTLYVMNADGSNARLLTELLEPGEPAWSPDGGKIAFSLGMRGTFEPNKAFTDTYVINVDGSGLTQLTRFAAGESSKTISISVGPTNVESYKIILSDNEGNATFVGGIKEATLTILRRTTAPESPRC